MGTGSQRPNIVFILADNVGWGDVGGGATPHIDALAREGASLSNYSVEVQGPASRSAILTGRLPVRCGTAAAPLPGQVRYGLAPWEYTLAEVLSDAGYATAAFGKWHLGEIQGRLPTDQGFDEWWGIKNSTDEAAYASHAMFRYAGIEPPKIWRARRGSAAEPIRDLDRDTRPFLDAEIAARAADYIGDSARRDRPFFLYAALTQIHPPMRVHPDFGGASLGGEGRHSEILAEVDHRVGQVVDAVDRAGLAEDTLIVFSSENATDGVSVGYGSLSGPWHGHFFTPPYEGSVRVPAFVRQPRAIPAGMDSDELFASVDWLATLAALAGVSDRVPADRPVDAIDASELLLGHGETSGRDHVLIFGPDGALMAAKWRWFKVIFRYADGAGKPIVTPMFPLVFDLSRDPHEDQNLLETRRDIGWVFRPILARIAAFQRSVDEHRNLAPGEDFGGYARRACAPRPRLA